MHTTHFASLAGATAFGLILGLGVSSSPVQEADARGGTAQEAGTPARGVQEAGADDIDEMMAAMMRAGTPGEAHKALNSIVGDFDAAMSWDQNGEKMEGTGAYSTKWIWDGRYIEGTFTSDWEGMPFEGRQIIGYSNLDQTYKSIWIDNMSTHMSYGAGYMSEDGKTLTMLASDPDVMTGEMKDWQDVYEMTDEDHYSFSRYEVQNGERGKWHMTIDYTRKGAERAEGR